MPIRSAWTKENAESQQTLANLAARPAIGVVEGQIDNGGSQDFAAAPNSSMLNGLVIKSGEMIQLSILPKNGHGADSTLVEMSITDVANPDRRWNLTQDMLIAAEQAAEASVRWFAIGFRSVVTF